MKKNILSLFLLSALIISPLNLEAKKGKKNTKNTKNSKKNKKNKKNTTNSKTLLQKKTLLQGTDASVAPEVKKELDSEEKIIEIKKKIVEIIELISKEKLDEEIKSRLEKIQEATLNDTQINSEEIEKYFNTKFKDIKNDDIVDLYKQIKDFNKELLKKDLNKSKIIIDQNLKKKEEKTQKEKRFQLVEKNKTSNKENNNIWKDFANSIGNIQSEEAKKAINEFKELIESADEKTDIEKLQKELSTKSSNIKKELAKAKELESNKDFIILLGKVKNIISKEKESEFAQLKKDITNYNKQQEAAKNILTLLEKKNTENEQLFFKELAEMKIEKEDLEIIKKLKEISTEAKYLDKQDEVIQLIGKITSKELLNELEKTFTAIKNSNTAGLEHVIGKMVSFGFRKTEKNQKDEALTKFLNKIKEKTEKVNN